MVGIDISERQINEAKINLPKVEFICADIRDHEFSPASFDGIVSFYCFNHIPRNSYEDIFLKFHQWLKKDGLLIASFGNGDTDEWTGEWLGTKTYFSSYNHKKTISIIKGCSFSVEDESVETELENGMKISFLWISARKIQFVSNTQRQQEARARGPNKKDTDKSLRRVIVKTRDRNR
jgi:cyclopropane fatty-acyl-phospholipid synthase-like methyltransferase